MNEYIMNELSKDSSNIFITARRRGNSLYFLMKKLELLGAFGE